MESHQLCEHTHIHKQSDNYLRAEVVATKGSAGRDPGAEERCIEKLRMKDKICKQV